MVLHVTDCRGGARQLESRVKMPKKFKGENTKAQDARAKKAAVREAAEETRKREEEDDAWRDNDKHVAKKQDRKVGFECFSVNYFFSVQKLAIIR